MLRALFLALIIISVRSFRAPLSAKVLNSPQIVLTGSLALRPIRNELKMNFLSDALRFFTNLNKEASAKHILIKGPGNPIHAIVRPKISCLDAYSSLPCYDVDAEKKLEILKEEINAADDISDAFSKIAAKVSECPSANRGGNLGTFKPGMMVKEFDQVVFEREVGKVHGPINTQFGSHLIYITRRYEGDEPEKK